MLRKLIIPLFVLGALAGCESSSSSDPDVTPTPTPTPTPIPTTPPNGNGDNGDDQPGEPQVINVSMSEDDDAWFANAHEDNPEPGSVVRQYVSGGVQYTPTFEDDQLLTRLAGPIDLRGAMFELEYEADSAFVESGADIQMVIQQRFGEWDGYWDCEMVTNAMLLESATGTIECELSADTDWAIDDEAGVQVGIQAKGGPIGAVTVLGLTVTLADADVEDPTTPAVTELSMQEEDGLWRVNVANTDDHPDAEALVLTYTESGVQYNPMFEDDQLVTDLDSPVNLNGAIFTFEYMVDADFIASGADLQPIVQEKDGWDGHYECYIGNTDMVADTAGTYECTMPADGWDVTHDAGIQLGVQAKGSPAGTVTLLGVSLTRD